MQVLIPIGGSLASSASPAVLLSLAIHSDDHEPVCLHILELDDLVATAGKFTPRLGLSGFCSIAVYSRPPTAKVTVRRPCLLVWRTRSRLPSASTSSALINCRAMEPNSLVSSILESVGRMAD